MAIRGFRSALQTLKLGSIVRAVVSAIVIIDAILSIGISKGKINLDPKVHHIFREFAISTTLPQFSYLAVNVATTETLKVGVC